ncbi:MAG: hypothetical protein WKF97_10875 [Chitinophagaceae bacterium]
MKKKSWILKLLLYMLIGVVAFCVFGVVVMSLWNALLPKLLNVPAINFIQATGLLLLSRILFGGFRHGYGGGWGDRKRPRWKQHMEEKWGRMTPEEREKFQQNWKSRCYQGKKPGEGKVGNME